MMLPHIALAVWLKSSFEKMMCWYLVLYALQHKDNVAAKYARGSFEIVATGNGSKKLK
jgi:hypothetical protein